MTNSIVGINTFAPHSPSQTSVSSPVAQPAPKPAPIQRKPDTVELSKTAQVKSLKRSGETVTQIAQGMGIDVKTVNSYLGTVPAK